MRTRSSFPALSRSHTARATRMWQEARYVVQVSRHQQQTMTLTRPGHTTHGHHGVHEKLQIPARAHRCAGVPREKWGTAGARGGDRGPPPRWRDPVPVHFPPPEPVLLAPQTKVAAFQGWRPAAAAGEVSTGASCWWWAEHTARLRANIHSVSALLPGACVPCCCT